VLVASPGYAARIGELESPEDLEELECLVHPGLPSWEFHHEGERYRPRLGSAGRIRANNSAALLAMARSGLGVALLASWLVDASVRAGRLVELLPEYSAPTAPIQALTAPVSHMPARVRLFLDFLDEALEDVP
jgi:DNA-binding transcriptional LysR family regulator